MSTRFHYLSQTLHLWQNNCSTDSLPRTHLSGGGCSTSVVDPNVNSYTQTRPPLVPTHRVGNERSAEHKTTQHAYHMGNTTISTAQVSITESPCYIAKLNWPNKSITAVQLTWMVLVNACSNKLTPITDKNLTSMLTKTNKKFIIICVKWLVRQNSKTNK